MNYKDRLQIYLYGRTGRFRLKIGNLKKCNWLLYYTSSRFKKGATEELLNYLTNTLLFQVL